MKKNVKITINSMMPITSIGAPLTRGTHGPVVLSYEDIFKCLIHGASVKEILEDNSEILLTLSNYNLNNNIIAGVPPVVELPAESESVNDGTADPVVEVPPVVELPAEPVNDGTADPVVEVPPVVELPAEPVNDGTADPVVELPAEPAMMEKSPAHWVAPIPNNQRNNRGKNHK